MKIVSRTAIAAGAVALIAGASAFSANAAPLGQNIESLKNSTALNTTEVQWRRHRGRNLAIGLGALGAGVVVGSAIANQQHYYGAPYGYYEQPYAYAPSYGYYSHGYYTQPYTPYTPYTANRSGNQVDSWDNPADYAQ